MHRPPHRVVWAFQRHCDTVEDDDDKHEVVKVRMYNEIIHLQQYVWIGARQNLTMQYPCLK